jgi:hypothetical protein
MKIKVTQSNIDMGVKHSATHCPIALALKDANLYFPTVEYNIMHFGPNDNRQHVVQTETICNFITAFDSDGYVIPFEFEV